MSLTIQDDSLEIWADELIPSDRISGDQRTIRAVSDSGSHETRTESQRVLSPIRKLKPLQFAAGLLCTTCGMVMILAVGIRAIEVRQLGEGLSMPMVVACLLAGVMLLGGGFGIMATSSSGFDEAEFDRLAAAGNISAVSTSQRNDIAQGGHCDASSESAA